MNSEHKRYPMSEGDIALESAASSIPVPLQRSMTIEPSSTQNSQNRPALPERAFSDRDGNFLASNGMTEDKDLEIPDVERDSDPTEVPVFLFSERTGAHLPFVAKYDTGSDDNWVAADILKKLTIRALKVTKASYWTLDGKEFVSDSIARISWCSQKTRKMRSSNFHVLVKKAPYEVIVGKETLLREKLVSFKKGGVAAKMPPKPDEKLEIEEGQAVANAKTEALKKKREAQKAQKVQKVQKVQKAKSSGEGFCEQGTKKTGRNQS